MTDNDATEATTASVGVVATREPKLVPVRAWKTRQALIVVVALAVIGTATIFAVNRSTTRGSTARNVMVILTDDQTLESMRIMRNVNALLAANGTTFSRFYTTSPNCCPSRGGYYTGQFPHNTGIRDNIPPLGGARSFVGHSDESLGVWMQRAGYYTAQIGKYLNGWGSANKVDKWTGGIVPEPGWDRWFVTIDPFTYQYYNFKVSDDGKQRDYGNRPEDYQTDVTGQEAVNTINRGRDSGKPWFITWSPMSPHIQNSESTGQPGEVPNFLSSVPANKYKGMFKDEPLPNVPSLAFDSQAATTPDVLGKPKYVQDRVASFPANRAVMTEAYRRELESLQSIDEWVSKIHQTLQDNGELDNTDIIFWSDNGLFHGEHGLVQKGLLYEEAAHLPLIIKGPGFPAGVTANQLTLNLDLPATILAIAGATASNPLDGRDLQPLASNPEVAKDRSILLEYWYSYSTITSKAIRSGSWSYIEWSTGDRELYDLRTDPFQMSNLAKDPRQGLVVLDLNRRLGEMSTCAGAACQKS